MNDQDQGPSNRRKWLAIGLASVLVLFSYWAILTAFVFAAAGRADPLPFFGFGVAVTPFVFVVLAFVSRHPAAPRAVLNAMGLALVVGVPLLALIGDAVTGVVAAYGAGGVPSLRPEPGVDWWWRAFAVALATAVVVVLVRVTPGFGLLVAPALPLTACGVADALGPLGRRPSE